MAARAALKPFRTIVALLFFNADENHRMERSCRGSGRGALTGFLQFAVRLKSCFSDQARQCFNFCEQSNESGSWRKNSSRLPLGLVAFSICLLFFPSAAPAEELTIISPQQTQVAGQPLRFHIQLRNFYRPGKVVVYYRAIGIARYRQLQMTPETEIDFSADLPGEKSFPPGIEFFFAVTDANNQVFTFPALDPRKNPFRIDINLDRAPPELLEHYPGAGISVVSTTPGIRLEFKDAESYVDPKTVRFILDDVDITSLCNITRTSLHYVPSRPLAPGEHSLALVLADAGGNYMPTKRWTFRLTPAAQKTERQNFDTASADIRVNGEYRQQISAENDSGSSAWKFQSSITADASAQKNNFKVSLKADANYIDEENFADEDDSFNLDEFLLQLEYGKQRLALGDVSVTGTELIASSIARRGARLTLDYAGVRLESFAVRSNYTTDYEKGLGISNSDQLLTGGLIEKDLFGNKKLTLKATYVNGWNKNPEDDNAGSLAAGTEGQIYSLLVNSRLFDEQLNFETEYAGSRFDSDLSDATGKSDDYAWRAKLSGRKGKFDGSAGYRYLGSEFRSIVNPTGANDREEYTLGGGVRFAASSLHFSAVHSENNVEQDPLYPVIKNTSLAVNYNLSVRNWPVLYLNYNQSLQGSDHEPEGFAAIESRTTSIGGGLTLIKNRWNLSPNYTYTFFDDRGAATDNDSRTHVMTLIAGFRPTDYSSINPVVSYVNTHSDATGVTTETWQSALSGFAMFYEGELNLHTTLSFLDTRTDDDTTHTSTYTAVTQLNWQVQKYLFKKGQQTFSLRGQYTRTENHVAAAKEDDYSIYAVFSFGVPIKLF